MKLTLKKLSHLGGGQLYDAFPFYQSSLVLAVMTHHIFAAKMKNA
jgi:hypothetical protein